MTCLTLIGYARDLLATSVVAVKIICDYIKEDNFANDFKGWMTVVSDDLEGHNIREAEFRLGSIINETNAFITKITPNWPAMVIQVFNSVRNLVKVVHSQVLPVIRTKCRPACPGYEPPAIAESQSNVLEELIYTGEIPDRVLASNTVMRYFLEPFDVIFDFLVNRVCSSSTDEIKEMNSIDIHRIIVESDENFSDYLKSNMSLSTFFDFYHRQMQLLEYSDWIERNRTRLYYSTYHPTLLRSSFDFHNDCPCCLAFVPHCYLEDEGIPCPDIDNCVRHTLPIIFEPPINAFVLPRFLYVYYILRNSYQPDTLTRYFRSIHRPYFTWEHFSLRVTHHVAQYAETAPGNVLSPKQVFNYEGVFNFPPVMSRARFCRRVFEPVYAQVKKLLLATDTDLAPFFLSLVLSGHHRHARVFAALTVDEQKVCIENEFIPVAHIKRCKEQLEHTFLMALNDRVQVQFRRERSVNIPELIAHAKEDQPGRRHREQDCLTSTPLIEALQRLTLIPTQMPITE